MEIQETPLREVAEELWSRHKAGNVMVHSIEIVRGVPEVQVVTVGSTSSWMGELEARLRRAHPRARLQARHQDSLYYLLAKTQAQESRPGSGIIRSVGGIPEGPGGTLTCFLSSKDGRDTYFAAAGHVVSNFWTLKTYDPEGPIDPEGSIYSYRKGFPPSKSRRFLGDLFYLTHQPRTMRKWPTTAQVPHAVDVDMGIAKFEGEFQWIQRTTCYGTFGEWPGDEPGMVCEGDYVMKCGAEETHWTFAQVESVAKTVWIYGPERIYELRGQVILKEVHDPKPRDVYESQRRGSCYGVKPVSFAVPGDSGTMVVDRYSKVPVGMLIGGSVLDGKYIMTPIHEIWKRWECRHLVLLRA